MYDILADMKRHQKDRDYEMVNTTSNGTQGIMEADSRLFQYGLPSLDRDWEPVLRDRLKPHDVTDGPVSENFDELDARGSIPAAELESALRDVGRFNLEHEFGISWNRVRDIVRQADVDRNGIIKYKEFLKTLSRYRLTTEQETKVSKDLSTTYSWLSISHYSPVAGQRVCQSFRVCGGIQVLAPASVHDPGDSPGDCHFCLPRDASARAWADSRLGRTCEKKI